MHNRTSTTEYPIFHPALLQLMGLRARARVRRLRRRFATPRRLVLSLFAVLFAVLWLGNAIISILFRQAADPELLRHWIPLGFAAYGIWHLVKVAYRRPEQDIEWSPAERAVLMGSPFTRRQLLSYRLATVFGATALKASCFAALMIPDLKLPIAGFVGALLTLLLLELWRMNAELVAFSVSHGMYTKLRFGVLACVAAAGLATVTLAVCATPDAGYGIPPTMLVLLKHLGAAAMQLEFTPVGQLVCAPFHMFSGIILADQYNGALLVKLVLGLLLVVAATALTYRVDSFFHKHRVQRQRRAYLEQTKPTPDARPSMRVRRNVRLLSWHGGGMALAWRQWRGAYHYRTSLLIAFAAPAVMALIPLVVYRDARIALLNVFGGIAFYSLLLLPPALRFDLRRDIDRMTLLKRLPISPPVMVVGQLAMPVVLASGFQLIVLAAAIAIRPVEPVYIFTGWLLLIPMNVTIFALDNLLFLLYPYRPNQEGLEVFLRTTLTFTAKGLLFALVLAITAAWALLAARIAHVLLPVSDPRTTTRLLFAAGFSLMSIAAAAATVRLTVRAYERFDVSQDVPA